MEPKTPFTKKDLIVILGCVLFLLANLGAITGGASRRAKEAVCLSNLLQWGTIFQMYANDNDGKTVAGFYIDPHTGEFYEHWWVVGLKPYFETFDFCLCPATTKTWKDGIFEGPFVGWDFKWLQGEYYEYYEGAYGSYGKNSWCSSEVDADLWRDTSNFWPSVNVKGANNIPLFIDCQFMGGFPDPHDEIPQWRDFWFMTFDGEMQRYCLDRHTGAINCLFLDFSARKVGLKQLWQLRWHQQWDTSNCPDPNEPSDWPEWMRDFKNY